MLANHLNRTFHTNFVVSGHPDGKGFLLKLNKQKEVQHFLNILRPFAEEIPSMSYKTDIQEKINTKIESIRKKYGESVNIIMSSSNRKRNYTEQEIETIIKLYHVGYTQEEIAKQLGRTYWSIIYKIRDLRKQGKM